MAILVGLLLAASGASAATANTEADYGKQMATVGKLVGTSLGSLSKVEAIGLRRTSDPSVAKKAAALLTDTQAQLRTAARRLRAIHPPAGAAAAHARLTQNVQMLAGDLTGAIRTMKEGLLVIGASMVQGLPEPAKIAAALRTISRGYPSTA